MRCAACLKACGQCRPNGEFVGRTKSGGREKRPCNACGTVSASRCRIRDARPPYVAQRFYAMIGGFLFMKNDRQHLSPLRARYRKSALQGLRGFKKIAFASKGVPA